MNKFRLIKYSLIIVYISSSIAIVDISVQFVTQFFDLGTSFPLLSKFIDLYYSYIYKVPEKLVSHVLLQSFTIYFFLLLKDIQLKAIPGVKMSPWISFANLIPTINVIVIYILGQNIYRSYRSIKESFAPPSFYLRVLFIVLLVSRMIIVASFLNEYHFNPIINFLINLCGPFILVLFARYLYVAYKDSEQMHYGA